MSARPVSPGRRPAPAHRRLTRTLAAGLVLTLPAVAAGCGGDDDATEAPPTTHDMRSMNLGDPYATPAADAGGVLVSGPFQLLDTRPPGLDGVAGTAELARRDDGTTVTIRLTGLVAGEAYLAHVHTGTCAEGEGHYRFDPDGSSMPPNEIHLALSASADGSGSMTAENDETVGPDARSVVIHPAELMDNWIACADLG